MVKRSRNDANSSSSAESNDEQSSKYIHTTKPNTSARTPQIITCELPPHVSVSFSTNEEFEVHYFKDHMNRCSDCGKNFPSDHFLQLHITENHDPISAARKARGERIFRCFVEDCDRICSAPVKRRRHLIDKHLFPRNYDFFIVNNGIDRRNSMLRRSHRRRRGFSNIEDEGAEQQSENLPSITPEDSRKSHVTPPMAQVEDADIQAGSARVEDIQDLTKSMSALRFVPPSVRFGRGGIKTFARS